MKKLSQTDRLHKLLSDGKEHRTDEIQQVVYGANHLGTARIASRIDDLRAKGYDIPKARRDENHPTLFWYRMNLTGPAAPKRKLVPMIVERDGIRFVRMVEEGTVHTQGQE